MKFILLHQIVRGEESGIWINADKIITIVPESAGKPARLYLDGYSCSVRETTGEIFSAVRRAEDGL